MTLAESAVWFFPDENSDILSMRSGVDEVDPRTAAGGWGYRLALINNHELTRRGNVAARDKGGRS
jgi:hypothetical protein